MTDTPGFLENLKDKAGEALDKGKELATDAVEAAKDKLDRDKDGEVMDDVKEMASDALEKGKEVGQGLVDKVKDLFDGDEEPKKPE